MAQEPEMSGATGSEILVVDDNVDVAKALVALASMLGYEAAAVHSGEEALAYVRRHPPALVLLDLHMPGMSGLDVLRALRSERRFDGLRVLPCSAAALPAMRREVLELGGQELLSKENAIEDLGAAIARQFSRHDRPGRGGHTPAPC